MDLAVWPGRLQQAEGNYAQSAATLDRALELWDRVGYAKGRAQALSGRGMTRFHANDPAATADLEEALAAFRAVDFPSGKITRFSYARRRRARSCPSA